MGEIVENSETEYERELFRQIVDGTLPEAEFQAVEQRLLTDIGFRERYVRAMDLECGLYEACQVTTVTALPLLKPRIPLKVFSMFAAGAFTLCGMYALFTWLARPAVPQIPQVARGQAAQTPVATIVRANQLDERQLTSFEPGMVAIPGILKIHRGELQLEFQQGTQINVEGPVELQILSSQSARLINGKLAVQTKGNASEFLLAIPGAVVTTRDAEFSLTTVPDGATELRVDGGEVSISLVGNPKRAGAVRTTAGAVLRINPAAATIGPIDDVSVHLPVIHKKIPHRPLMRTRLCNILPFSEGTVVPPGK